MEFFPCQWNVPGPEMPFLTNLKAHLFFVSLRHEFKQKFTAE